MSEHRPGGRRAALARSLLLLLLGCSVALQLGLLYSPVGPGELPFPQADKVVHAAVFALPTMLGLLLRLPPRPLVLVLAGHAFVSEVVQALVLRDRTGDPLDVLADLVGVGLGVAAAWAVDRWTAGRLG